jgi:hypothetical protein
VLPCMTEARANCDALASVRRLKKSLAQNWIFGLCKTVVLLQWIHLHFYAKNNCIIQINHQPHATIFQFIILTFIYSWTCFGRFPAHYQELNDCSGSLWFYLRFVVTVVLCSWSGRPAGPTTNTAWLSPQYEGKTRGFHCTHWSPDDGRKNARNMLSCKQMAG